MLREELELVLETAVALWIVEEEGEVQGPAHLADLRVVTRDEQLGDAVHDIVDLRHDKRA